MKLKNNVGILNFWWATNYGAILTAYALTKIIEAQGKKVALISNADNTQIKFESKYTFSKNFAKKYLNTCLLKNNNLETYVVGSDQVFRPHLNKRIADSFLLDFADINSKKIAFSASFGVDKEKFLLENSNQTIKKMKNALKTFDFISVREKSGVEICRDLFDVKAEWIIDPVFILDKSKYDELIQNTTKDYSNKIVSYLINPNNNINKYKNKKIIKLANSNESVENWLSAIKNCKLLITDSFHGMCFALIFNKPFICVVNSSTGSTRYDSVFEMLGIKNQCLHNINEIYEKDCTFKVDYDVVNKHIEEERQRGLDFLKMALEAPVQVTQEKIVARLKFLENKVCELEQQATLKYQIKKELWNLWLIIFHKYLPEPVKNVIRLVRDILCK